MTNTLGNNVMLIINNATSSLSFWDIISDILGWSYFVIWSWSFYPQVYLNWKRKSVRGLSVDFIFYNILGYFCYSVYTLAFYSSQEIRDEYKERHPNSDHNLVRLNDVVFAVHSFLISSFLLIQTCIYKKHDKNQQISSFTAGFVWFSVMCLVLVVSAVQYGGAKWIIFLYFLSSVKLITSFIKFMPQVWVNYKHKSTQGWSIHYIIWDLVGGLFSILQLIVDAYIDGDWTGIEGYNVKLGLGLISVGYDVLFLIQHYRLYSSSIQHHEERLIGQQDATNRKKRNSYYYDSNSDFEDDDENEDSSHLPNTQSRQYGSISRS